EAVFLFERLFPFNPQSTATRLALVAAVARHSAAFEPIGKCLHLFSFDEPLDEAGTLDFAYDDSQFAARAISSRAEFQQHLLQITGQPRSYSVVERRYDVALHIRLREQPDGMSLLLWQAQTLAWAYLEGKPNEPVFPYIVE